MNLDKVINSFYAWFPFILLFLIFCMAVGSEFGCTASADGSVFNITDNIVRAIQENPRVIG